MGGHGDPGTLGQRAVPPVERLWIDRVKPLPASEISSEAAPDSAPAQPPAGPGQQPGGN